jgi:hypothetical protein
VAVAHGLTALVADVKKCADNSRGQARKRSHEAMQGQACKGTQEVEERSRWRWSPRRVGVHRNQDRFIPSQGPGHSAGPLPVHPLAMTEPFRTRRHGADHRYGLE